MNLYSRLIWTLLRAWWLPRLRLADVFERTLRVLPNDIDINLHMNNGRYLTVADLMIVEFFARTGFLGALLKNKWKPVLGGSIITYRKQLKLGQRYKLRYRWVGSDSRWNYMKFEFLAEDGSPCAVGYCKGGALSLNGIVDTNDSFAAINQNFEPKELPVAVLSWRDSEQQLMDSMARHQKVKVRTI